MTKEQKAIQRLKYLLFIYKDDLEDKYLPTGELFNKDFEAIETVLNMLKEKDAELEKKDKMIDLMAEELQKHIFVLYDGDTITSKKGIIQHYERKVEDEKNKI